jgi:UDP-N-acetylglucosamine:LPS N-acetylglucosamine transferase
MKKRLNLEVIVCVTAQHRQMLDQVLSTFGVVPDYDLNIMKDRQTLFDITTNILNGIKAVLEEVKPDVVFSKGGFVSVPVVVAGKKCKVPTIIHESDMTPGLANKLAFPSAVKVCCNFPETVKYLPEGKAVMTGSPIRRELLCGDSEKGRAFCRLTGERPVLMIIGGSLGSVAVNTAIRRILPELLKTFQVVHLCGKGNLDESLEDVPGYRQYEYIRDELPDLFALADVVVSRAGAGTVFEILALKKRALLVPLEGPTRGDQKENAAYFSRQGLCKVLSQTRLDKLPQAIDNAFADDALQQNLVASSFTSGNATILRALYAELEK